MVLVVWGGQSQDQGRERDPTLMNRQVETLRNIYLESIGPARGGSKFTP